MRFARSTSAGSSLGIFLYTTDCKVVSFLKLKIFFVSPVRRAGFNWRGWDYLVPADVELASCFDTIVLRTRLTIARSVSAMPWNMISSFAWACATIE